MGINGPFGNKYTVKHRMSHTNKDALYMVIRDGNGAEDCPFSTGGRMAAVSSCFFLFAAYVFFFFFFFYYYYYLIFFIFFLFFYYYSFFFFFFFFLTRILALTLTLTLTEGGVMGTAHGQ